MKVTNYIFTLLAFQKQVNFSKENLLVNYQNNCQNLDFEESWFNNSGFGIFNKFGSLDYYNCNRKNEIAVVKVGQYIMEFGFIKIDDNNTMLDYKSNKNNYFTRYIGNWFINSEIETVCKKPKTNNIIELYKKWFKIYKNYDVFSW